MLVGELINAVELLAGAICDDRSNRLFAGFRYEIFVQLNRRLEVMRPAKQVIPGYRKIRRTRGHTKSPDYGAQHCGPYNHARYS
ncbi:hypothetical protein PHISCL_10845 [Aspergillus sclerotialis]|uniref:Uncharacterized protein n=1 Tax=Aspergillus sclerotialis TaxID=2070753 RepID=A0A3A2Z130_9EURO|nr:hypothetical protein PHISCL_10845 [Aspergillus sclerotialis]